jgi:hypothetical protein
MERIPNIAIPRERLGVPIVERVPPPIVNLTPPPVVNGITPPVVNIPVPRIEYPKLPPMGPITPTPSTPRTSNRGEEKEEKEREGLKPTLPPLPPPPRIVVPPQPVESPQVELEPVEMEAVTIEIAGTEVELPTPQQAIQASATAVVGTSVTLATAMVFNQARRVVGEAATKLKRNKFKIKLRQIRPVLHFVDDGHGNVEVIEYSGEGVKVLASDVKSPEQYLRDTIEADELFEVDHRIVIDDHLKEKFSKEGAKRFNYFAPPKKMARRLAARFIFG